MTEGLEAITSTALGLALDAASLRQQAIASNIANVNTAGYVSLKVNFEDQLGDARRLLQSQGNLDAASLADVVPYLEQDRTETRGLTSTVRLDVQVADMAQNAVRYQALLKGLSKQYAILSAAVSDGKK